MTFWGEGCYLACLDDTGSFVWVITLPYWVSERNAGVGDYNARSVLRQSKLLWHAGRSQRRLTSLTA